MNSPPTIILPDYVGRLGNRLFIYIHTLAACMHWRFHCINLTLQPHANLFKNLKQNSLCSFPSPKQGYALHKLARGIRAPLEWMVKKRLLFPGFIKKSFSVVNFQNEQHQRMDTRDFADRVRSSRWTILWGWANRADCLLGQYQNDICAFLKINEDLNPNLTRELKKSGESGHTKVCIHIRYGDRRIIPGQTLPLNYYIQQASRLKRAHPDKNLEFWICSDEPIDLSLFPIGSKASKNKSLNEDFQIMVSSDYLIGGVSTLSRSACFLGKSRFFDCTTGAEVPVNFQNWCTGLSALLAKEFLNK